MQLKYLSKNRFNNSNGLLSATKLKEQQLSLQKSSKNETKLLLKTKQILKVYIEYETGKKLVEAGVARLLGITNIRPILTENPKYYEISQNKIDEFISKGNEVEYIKLPKKVKQKIEVFYEDNKFYINTGAAYALGYIDVKQFNNENGLYGPLTTQQIESIKYNFIMELQNIKKEESKTL